MKRFNDSKIRMVLFVFAAAIVIGIGSANADFTFDEPVNLGPPVNTSASDYLPLPSTDELSLYFLRVTGVSDPDALWLTTRATIHNPWSTPINLGLLVDWFPCRSIEDVPGLMTADGLEQYGWGTDGFWGPDGYGGVDIWVTTRGTIDDDWGTPMNLGPLVNSSADEASLAISPDGLELYFSGYRSAAAYVRPGGYGQSDLWVTKRATRNDPWGQPVNLGPLVNSAYQDLQPSISVDGLVLFFDSTRPGGYGQQDLYMTRRASIFDPWQAPVNLGPVINSLSYEEASRISTDGCSLYFDSGRPGGYGGYDIWQAAIIPIVDLNSDGIVDASDMCIVLDHWGEDYPLCDIGPMPWGDGIVDVQDLIVLAEHLFEETTPVE